MAPRRVLHVMRMSGVGGSENHLRALLPELPRRGWEPDLLVPSPRPSAVRALAEDLSRSCGRVVVAPMRSDLSLALFARLARHMRSGQYDLIHSHLVHADWHTAAASLCKPRTPVVSTKHNPDRFRELRTFGLAERAAESRCDEIVAISESLRQYTLQFAPTRTPVATVLYGLAAPPTAPDRGSEAAAPTLLTLARLVHQKGLDVLIRAMPRVVEAVPDVELLIAGEGPARRELERLIDGLRLQAHVRLLGHRDDAPELMRRAWLMVHPARWEGFGLVLLEAMKAGLPVVATRVSAIPEVVVDGVTGRLVPPDDVSALAEVVIASVRDSAFRREAGTRGFERLTARFSAERMALETVEVYERVLRGRAR